MAASKGAKYVLRKNIVEHFDFEVLFPSLWLYLYSWFSADCQIARYLRKDRLNSGQLRLDLYPESTQDKMNNSMIGFRGRIFNDIDDSSSSEEEFKDLRH